MNNSTYENNRTIDMGSVIYYYTSIALVPLFAFAFILNVFLLYVLLQEKVFQSITYKLIRISVISDTMSSLTAVIGYSLVAQDFSYQSGKLLCQIIFNLAFTFNGISMNNLCLIAMDRYFAIVKPLSRFHRRYRRRIFFIEQIASWLLSIFYNLFLVPYIGGTPEDPTLCDVPEIDRYIAIPIIIIMFCIMQYILPCSLIANIYWRIIYHQKHYVRPGQNSRQPQEQELKKKKFIKILITITLWYVLTTWPFFAGITGMAVTRQSVLAIRKRNLAEFLFLFYSLGTSIGITLINPFIYLKFDSNIRTKFFDVLLRKNKQGN
ncbi:Muscarinic acetylcholine receptor M2 [Trichoplax sp. H2]|nr:Muscarinic acetylcholine receptor M2 [Trichoplax sp. H2]|eukprot:RDD45987.1 Muscarinic acetylcholine receptor M2 [Trichoplax sp. H2]